MKARRFWLFIVILALLSTILACRVGRLEPTPTPVPQSQPSGQATSAGTSSGEPSGGAAPTAASGLQDDVPVMDGALNLIVTAKGTYVKYEVVATVDEATEFYKTKMAELGWEQINKQDVSFGGNITLLRGKEDKNITVTIQSIPESDQVRVLINVIPK